jgi:hypothetical protein
MRQLVSRHFDYLLGSQVRINSNCGQALSASLLQAFREVGKTTLDTQLVFTRGQFGGCYAAF